MAWKHSSQHLFFHFFIFLSWPWTSRAGNRKLQVNFPRTALNFGSIGGRTDKACLDVSFFSQAYIHRDLGQKERQGLRDNLPGPFVMWSIAYRAPPPPLPAPPPLTPRPLLCLHLLRKLVNRFVKPQILSQPTSSWVIAFYIYYAAAAT